MTTTTARMYGRPTDERNERNEQTPRGGEVSSSLSLSSSPGAPVLDPAALYGVVGDCVRAIAPHTEASEAALVAHILTMAGSAIGPGPAVQVGADRHRGNLFVCIVGPTSTGRKGTALSEARRLLAGADPDWLPRVVSGLSSGEGLIHKVRDPLEADEPIKERGRIVDYQRVVKDAGESDKRLLVVESEFASVLRVSRRDGSTLSTTVRQAWDSGDLRVLTRNSPEVATGAYVSIIGHITADELQREMLSIDLASGFANRFLFIASTRSKVLPFGGALEPYVLDGLALRLARVFATARTRATVTWDAEARAVWGELYETLTTDRPGLAGAVCARAAPLVIRLALVYALLDDAPAIRLPHLRAALAVWDYAAATARQVFGERIGDKLADFLLAALRANPDGLTRSDLHQLLGRNTAVQDLEAALDLLRRYGLATPTLHRHEKGGRPAERWRVL